jgi:hypothetical protein
MLIEDKSARGVYNVCSDCRMQIGEMLEVIASIVGIPPHYEIDERLWRPADISPIVDASRLKAL